MIYADYETLDSLIERTKVKIYNHLKSGQLVKAKKLATYFKGFLNSAEEDLEESICLYEDALAIGLKKEDQFGMILSNEYITYDCDFVIPSDKLGKLYWKILHEEHRIDKRITEINKTFKSLSHDITLNLFKNNPYDPASEYLLKQGVLATFTTSPVFVRSFVIDDVSDFITDRFAIRFNSPIDKLYSKKALSSYLQKNLNVIGIIPKRDISLDIETAFAIGAKRYLQEYIKEYYS